MKSFVNIFIVSVFLILGSISLFNWYIDPMWCFSHQNKYNQYQMTFNERQQKINTIHFQDFNYNALMLGSSRVAYINPHDITNYKAYNLAVAHMQVSEYSDYINYAKKKKGSDFDLILLGLDFTTATQEHKQKNISEYTNKANELGYRYKLLFSLDTLKFSTKNFKNVALEKYKKRGRTCDRNYVTHAYKKSKAYVIDDINQYLFPHPYHYNENYKKALKNLIKENPKTKFLVFITPISSKRFKYIFEKKENRDLYKRWLKESIEVFSEVENFMYLNDVTRDYADTFNGVGHYYPYIGTKIINKVFHYPQEESKYKNFGMPLTKENVDVHLIDIFSSFK